MNSIAGFLFLITLFAFIGCSDRRPHEYATQKQEGLWGAVEKLEETTFHLRSDLPLSKFYSKEKRILIYNNREHLIEEIHYGTFISYSKTSYTFNEDDLIVSAVTVDTNNLVVWTAAYIYSDTAREYLMEQRFFDAQKKLMDIQRFYYGLQDSSEFTEDRLLYNEQFDPSGTLIKRNNFYYDNDGQLIKHEIIFHPDKGVITQKYEYDNKGNKIVVKTLGVKDKSYSRSTYTYEYDRYQNWTRRHLINPENNFVKEITTREFTYRH